MATRYRAVRTIGGVVALCGLVVAAAFVGRRTAGPVAALVLGPLDLLQRLLGIGAGVALLLAGLFVANLGARWDPEQGQSADGGD